MVKVSKDTKEVKKAVRSSKSEVNSSKIYEELDPHTKKILKIKEIVKKRDELRENGDYLKADSVRELLKVKYNVDLIDQKGGPSGWKFLDGSSTKIASNIKLPTKEKDSNVDSEKKTKTSEQREKEKELFKKLKDKEIKKEKNTQLKAEYESNTNIMKNMLKTNSNTKNINGVMIEELEPGFGQRVKAGDRVRVHYIGKLKSNNKVFDSSSKKPFQFKLGAREVITGWDIGINGMAIGSKRRLTIPPEKAYGKSGAPPSIPGNATLIFEVTLLGVA